MKRRVLFILIIILIMTDTVLAVSYSHSLDFSFLEESFYYEIGFTNSKTDIEPLDAYFLALGDDGSGHDNDDLFFYWEITGKNFVVELTGSDLKSGDDSLSLDISWTGKEENSNVILASDDSVYSGKGAIELDLSTAPVTEAAIGTYDTTLKLTIRRTS